MGVKGRAAADLSSRLPLIPGCPSANTRSPVWARAKEKDERVGERRRSDYISIPDSVIFLERLVNCRLAPLFSAALAQRRT